MCIIVFMSELNEKFYFLPKFMFMLRFPFCMLIKFFSFMNIFRNDPVISCFYFLLLGKI
jgi:hypothetical protein